jgi:hypothetical protein
MVEFDSILGGIMVLACLALVVGILHVSAMAKAIKLEMDIHTHQLDVIRARLSSFQLPAHPSVTRVASSRSSTSPRLQN